MKEIVKLTDKLWKSCKDEELSTVVSALLSLATTVVVNSEDPEVMFIYVASLRELVDNLDSTHKVMQ